MRNCRFIWTRTVLRAGWEHGCTGALFAMLRLQGVKTVYGAVTVPNPASERLHTACGFTKLGTYHSTGYKCGKWHDVAWFEKSIAPCAGPPQPVLPIHAVPQAQLAAILENA